VLDAGEIVIKSMHNDVAYAQWIREAVSIPFATLDGAGSLQSVESWFGPVVFSSHRPAVFSSSTASTRQFSSIIRT
jgi:imidazole glycerol phosphate synthase subunit HisF